MSTSGNCLSPCEPWASTRTGSHFLLSSWIWISSLAAFCKLDCSDKSAYMEAAVTSKIDVPPLIKVKGVWSSEPGSAECLAAVIPPGWSILWDVILYHNNTKSGPLTSWTECNFLSKICLSYNTAVMTGVFFRASLIINCFCDLNDENSKFHCCQINLQELLIYFRSESDTETHGERALLSTTG